MPNTSNVVALHQTQFSAKLPPKKPRNADIRPREYLTTHEVGQLIKAAKQGRYGHRDATLVLLMYRHGLRVSEAASVRWDQVDLKQGLLTVTRVKNGQNGIHPLTGRELRALRQLKRNNSTSPFMFLSERGTPMTDRNVRTLVKNAGERAGMAFPVHPHRMLTNHAAAKSPPVFNLTLCIVSTPTKALRGRSRVCVWCRGTTVLV